VAKGVQVGEHHQDVVVGQAACSEQLPLCLCHDICKRAGVFLEVHDDAGLLHSHIR
jgi:hypothetical protein